jgi:hypothetical protein
LREVRLRVGLSELSLPLPVYCTVVVLRNLTFPTLSVSKNILVLITNTILCKVLILLEHSPGLLYHIQYLQQSSGICRDVIP